MEDLIYKTMRGIIAIEYNPEIEHVIIKEDYIEIAKLPVEFIFDFLYKALLGNPPKSIHVARRRGQMRMAFPIDFDYSKMAENEFNIPSIEFNLVDEEG